MISVSYIGASIAIPDDTPKSTISKENDSFNIFQDHFYNKLQRSKMILKYTIYLYKAKNKNRCVYFGRPSRFLAADPYFFSSCRKTKNVQMPGPRPWSFFFLILRFQWGFFLCFFYLGFTALSRTFHLYRADRSSKVGENWRTPRKTTWPSISRTWLSHIWSERGSNHSGEKPNGLRVNSLIH